MNVKHLIFGALFACLAAGQAAAVTKSLTEGIRDRVDGTTRVTGTDSPNDPDGYGLGVLGFGAGAFSQFDIHGRIVGAADYFNFTATSDFTVELIFDGVFVDGTEIASGFVREGARDNKSIFDLALNGASVASTILMTDITSAADNGGTSLLFHGTAGSLYTIGIDNKTTNPSKPALYDIRISAVPLPAALPLLLVALGGLGLMARRRAA